MDKIKKWVCTDVDNQQYVKKMTETVFIFKEFDKANYNLTDELLLAGYDEFKKLYFNCDQYWIIETIDLNDYTEEEKIKCVLCYYSIEEYHTLSNDIIAECIFETEYMLY